MKLPKPGKIKLPKPRADKPAGDKGDILSKIGGFRIKNRFLQKNLISLIVIAVLAIGTGTVYGTLSSRDADRGEDPVYGVNQDRYQVLVSGEGYKLSKKQEKDYKLQKKQNEVNAANALQNPNTISYPNGYRTFRSSSSYRSIRYKYNSHYSYKSSKKPRITSDVSSEINKLDNPVAGDTFKIKVTAYAYPYGTKNAISSNNIKVNVEGGTATLYKSKSGSHYYKIELGEGKNKITITATDKKTKKKAKLGPYTVKVGAGESSNSGNSNNYGNSNTDPTKETGKPETTEQTIAVTVQADDENSDPPINVTIEVNDETTVADVLKEAKNIHFTDDGDIDYIEGHTSLNDYEDQLREKYKEDENITGDIEEGAYEAWLAANHIEGEVKKGNPFESTQWNCDPGLTEKVKDLTNGITLTLTLY